MSSSIPLSFSQDEWAHRRIFIATITDICRRENINLAWLSDFWVARLEKEGRVQFITAYQFPLNTEAAAATARDKVATFHVLRIAGVPVVAHWLVRFPPNRPIDEVAQTALRDVPLPLVLKPCNLGGGRDVYKVNSHAELTTTLTKMAVHYRTIASSPFEDITDEYRLVLFDFTRLILFRKVRPAGEWRHNVHFGAAAAVVEDAQLAARLEALAIEAMQTLRLRFAAVDIIATPEGLKVMEVNTNFGLNGIAIHPEFEGSYEKIYHVAVRGCFA